MLEYLGACIFVRNTGFSDCHVKVHNYRHRFHPGSPKCQTVEIKERTRYLVGKLYCNGGFTISSSRQIPKLVSPYPIDPHVTRYAGLRTHEDDLVEIKNTKTLDGWNEQHPSVLRLSSNNETKVSTSPRSCLSTTGKGAPWGPSVHSPASLRLWVPVPGASGSACQSSCSPSLGPLTSVPHTRSCPGSAGGRQHCPGPGGAVGKGMAGCITQGGRWPAALTPGPGPAAVPKGSNRSLKKRLHF